MEIPLGFRRHDRSSPVTRAWEPIYAQSRERAVVLAIRASEAHTNARGLVHGGLISALADNAMGLSCARQLASVGGLLTLSLSVDFVSVARVGQWVTFETDFTKIGGTVCFAQAFVKADGAVCARASASFRVAPERAAGALPDTHGRAAS